MQVDALKKFGRTSVNQIARVSDVHLISPKILTHCQEKSNKNKKKSSTRAGVLINH